MRAAGSAERKSRPRPERAVARDPTPLRPSRKRSLVVAIEGTLLTASIAGAVLLSTADQWDPPELVGLLAVLAWGSDFLTLETKRARISGSFLGLVLAMALLGPSPAVAIGLGCAIVDALHARTRGLSLLANAATYAFFPLVGGVVLTAIHGSAFPDEGGYPLSVFAVFCLTNLLNFTMVAGHIVLTRGGPARPVFA